MKNLLVKYKNVLLYLVFGALTTMVNIVTYYITSHVFGIATMPSNVVAWILAVVFAYITNRIWVFNSHTMGAKEILREIIYFGACRLFTGFVDIVIMYIFVDCLHYNDLVIKIISNVIVIVLNYVGSKFVIFKKK